MKPKILFLIDTLGFLEISSIPILSALAKKKGHEVQFAEFGRNPKRALRKIESFCPDIVAYSICSNEARNYLEINRFLKKRFNFYSLFGGAHPTFFPRFIKEEGVDAICRGEADRVFVQFLEFFGRDKMFEVNNFSFKMPDGTYIENPLDDLVENLSELPFPDRGILYENSRYHAKNPIKYFFAGRGCPYNCSYCFNHSYNALYHGKGRILRTKSVTYLLNEIKDTARK
ncbi:MAG: cobalamin-dependent protein, partial [Elusimicrobiota bacterium]